MANGDSPTTRSLTLPDTTLLAWPGVAPYLVDVGAASATPNAFPATGQTFVFYEVSTVTGQGSWWLVVAPQAQVPPDWFQDAFGGVEVLAASGSGIATTSGDQPILRPVSTLLWIPQATLDQASPQPVSNDGQVLGSFPDFAPPSTPGAQTRSLYLLDSTLMSWPGVGAWSVPAPNETPAPLAYTPVGQAFQFYEVSVVDGQGSWWLPVAPQASAPAAWSQTGFGGGVPLQASGRGIWTSAGGQPLVRPATALWWIPELTLADNMAFAPAINDGAVSGRFPTLEPPAPPTGGGPTAPGGGGTFGTGPPPAPSSRSPSGWPREPAGGPQARERHFLLQRAVQPGTAGLPPGAPSTGLAPARANAVRAHRTRQRQAVTRAPTTPAASPAPTTPSTALAVRPAAQPSGTARRARFGQAAQPGIVNWTPLGPSVVLHGMAATRPPVSGRVMGVGVSADGQRVYAGTANGGVWRSDDAGRTWYPLMNAFDLHPTANHADSLSIGALAIVPDQPDRVYVGSGEGALNFLAYLGVGPIVSDDGGLSWRVERAPADALWFYALAVDPVDPERVLAATSTNVLRRQPRNEAVPGLPAIKPQSYFVRYDTAAGAYSVNYWAHDGNSAFDVFAAGALAWQRHLTLTPFVNGGEPWFVSYEPAGSFFPWRAGGEYRVYRIAPEGQPSQRQMGVWALGLMLMPFELDGRPYLVRYAPATGLASLDAWNPDGTLTPVWANRQWERHLTQLMPFVLGGVPHFLAYRKAGVVANSWATLYAWTGTGETYAVWNAARQIGNDVALMPFDVDGVPFFQRYAPASGVAHVARWSPDGEFTDVAGMPVNMPAGLRFTPFVFQGRPRAFGYDASTGVTSLYAYQDDGTAQLLWRTPWGAGLAFMPFQMGHEWVRVDPLTRFAPPPATSFATSVVVARGGDTTAFYAAFWNGGIYRSTDGGNNWGLMGTNAPGLPGGVGRVTLAVPATHPGVVFAQLQNGEIWRYDVSATPLAPLGGVWVRIANEPANYVGTQGNYDLAIAVAPDDVNRVYLGGSAVLAPPGGLPAIQQWSGAIYRCDVDVAGATMTPTYIGGSTHSDVHALVFAPGQANALWAATDGGLFLSLDPARPAAAPGALERLFASRNDGLASMTANALAQHPTQDALVFSANQDNGAQRYTGSAAWSLPRRPQDVLGDAGRVVVNAAAAGNGQQVLSTYTNNTIFRSADGGSTWGQVAGNGTAQINPLLPGETVNFYAPLVAAASTAAPAQIARVVFGTRRPWFSDDFGVNWAAIGALLGAPPPGAEAQFNINAVALSADALKLYVGLMNGQIYKYTDAGGVAGPPNWGAPLQLDNAAGGALPGFAAVPITSLVVDPDPAANGDSIYITLGGDLSAQPLGWQRVWYFDNATNAWQARSGPVVGGTPQNLLNVQFNTLAARRVGGATQLFAGADVGVWRSDNSGATWAPFSNALPEAPVLDLQIFPAAPPIPPLLRAATYGRGAFEYVLDDDARYRRPVQLYVRATILDRGLYPVQDGAANPIAPAQTVNHRDGLDIKLNLPVGGPDSDTFPAPGDISFSAFATLPDQSQALVVNRRLRVYVQIHNRGVAAADKVRVMLLLSRRFDPAPPPPPIANLGALAAPPLLPRGYTAHVQADTPVRSADWNTKIVLSRNDVRAGFPEVLSADLPQDTLRQPGLYCLLAIVNNDDNPFTSQQTDVDQLTIAESQVAMKYLFVT